MSRMNVDGTLLALDWGAKKIGYATADSEGRAVTPRGTLRRQDPPGTWKAGRHDLAMLLKLVAQFEVRGLVLGCPGEINDEKSPLVQEVRALAARISKELGLSVQLRSEELTSWESRTRQGKGGPDADDDAGAAAVLLEDYFHSLKRAQQSGRVGILSAVLLSITAVIGALAWAEYRAFYVDPLSKHLAPALLTGAAASKPALLVDVKPGMNFHQLRKLLNDRGLHSNDLAFRFWLHTQGRNFVLKPGEYRLEKTATLAKAFGDIGTGAQILHKLTVKEGFNLWDIENEFKDAFGPRMEDEANLEALVLGGEPDHVNPEAKKVGETFWRLATDKKLVEQTGVRTSSGARRTLEGFLFPETYSFRKYESPRIVIDAMLEQFKARALPILESHPSWGSTPEGRYRLLTLASIVEKESGDYKEQPIIASVFWNRLAKRMKLQSDPTIIYGLMPGFDGNIHKGDILKPTPYNTYTIPELPAGPIANPGETALRAVANPAFTDYLFFVSKGNGEHLFSRDYKTHAAYVDQFQRRKAPALSQPAVVTKTANPTNAKASSQLPPQSKSRKLQK